MRKSCSFRCAFFALILLFLSLAIFSLKTPVHSQTGTEDISLENNPYGIAINPETNTAVITVEKDKHGRRHSGTGYVSVVDLNTQTILSTISVGKKPRGVAIDKGLNLAVIGNSHDNTVSIIDLNTNKVTATIPVGKSPQGMAINQSTHRAYVTNHKDDTISVIDLFSRQNLGIIQAGNEPIDIAIDPNLNLALVINQKEHTYRHKHGHRHKQGYTVSVIDLSTYQITGQIPVGKKPQAIAINPETHLAAVVNEKDNTITVINLNSPSPTLNQAEMGEFETTTIPVGKHPTAITINQLDNRALVICDEDYAEHKSEHKHSHNHKGESLLIIDLNTNKIIKNYEINKKTRAVAVNNLTNIAGVIDDKTDSLTLIQLPNPIPEITSITPANTQRGSDGIILTIEGNKFTTSSVGYFNSQAVTTAFTDNHHIRITVPREMLANAGVFPVTVVNPQPEGGSSNSLSFTVSNPLPSKPLEIKITSPLNGETINKSKTIVKGTIKSDTKDIGIKVNGTLAEVSGNDWTANNIPLTIGANTITATATDSQGNTDTKKITINTSDITQKVQLSANITNSIAPLTTYFSVSTSFIPVSYQMDFEGDGIVDYTGATFANMNHTYSTEGIFYPTVTVVDDQGNTYSDTIAITVMNKIEIDNLLKSKWEGMKGALAVGDINRAIINFDSASQGIYRNQFTALKPILLNIVNELNTAQIDMVFIENEIAEYELLIARQGKSFSFHLKFVKDGNGLWKIWSY